MGIQNRREREKERRRQQILVAAKRIFLKKGFAGATMEEIAREAELSPGTLYLYFKNKNELSASLTLRVLQFLMLRLEQVHDERELDQQGKIASIKHALMDVSEFDPFILRRLFMLQSRETLSMLSNELVEQIIDLRTKALNAIANIFKQGIEGGIYIDLHPATIADIVWSLFSGIIMLEFSKQPGDGEKDHLGSTLCAAFDIFEKGIMLEEKRTD